MELLERLTKVVEVLRGKTWPSWKRFSWELVPAEKGHRPIWLLRAKSSNAYTKYWLVRHRAGWLKVTMVQHPSRKIQAIKVARRHLGLGLKEAKRLVEETPPYVLARLPPARATSFAAELREAGMVVEVESNLSKLAALASELPPPVDRQACPWVTHAALTAARQLWKDAGPSWREDADRAIEGLEKELDQGVECLCDDGAHSLLEKP